MLARLLRVVLATVVGFPVAMLMLVLERRAMRKAEKE